MDSLTAAFYDVMYQYRLPFSPEGVTANLTAWRENKTPLVELLRRHPNWNEQELAVVFDFAESREIDHNSVDENKFEMIMLAHDAGLDDIKLSDFQAALDAATADYATVPDVSRLETIRTRGISSAPRARRPVGSSTGSAVSLAWISIRWSGYRVSMGTTPPR